MAREIAKEWITKAEEDFRYALVGLEHSELFALVCFHFQQPAEKYLKAVIVEKELGFRPVHDLNELIAIIEKALPEARSIGEDCAFINPFYIDTRYPVH
jgi:HEPN domain-containing protein